VEGADCHGWVRQNGGWQMAADAMVRLMFYACVGRVEWVVSKLAPFLLVCHQQNELYHTLSHFQKNYCVYVVGGGVVPPVPGEGEGGRKVRREKRYVEIFTSVARNGAYKYLPLAK
jgi:hypothetical protein